IPPGTIFALLGENGAGKTTALKILLGLLEPSTGQVRVLGIDPQADGLAVRRRVGYLPEQPALYDWMTVGELGWFASGFYSGSTFLENYRRLADELSVPWAKKIKALSKGTRAKAALALALAQDPELLVLDEPTSGLDLLVRHEILDRMVDLAAKGKTVILSSHQVAEVERVADTVAIIHHGRLVVLAPLEDLKEQTQELVVTLHNGAVPPAIPGEMLRSRQHARQWQILVRGCSEGELDRLRHDKAIEGVEVRRPGLEEIVAGYLRSDPAEAANAAEQPR
ncbi:MAG TPA: ABC transporter ATP-binding protein, partial [Pirellulales bacterium]|nr:ABC transporter ATP-binding protein [Pirellulales bacterium]